MTAVSSLRACLRFEEILSSRMADHYRKARIKQFLGYVRKARPEIQDLFREVCIRESLSEIIAVLEDGIRNPGRYSMEGSGSE